MPELYRIRVKYPDLEVEVESSDREYVEAKLDQYLNIQVVRGSSSTSRPTEPGPARSRRQVSMSEFVKRVNPHKKNEVAAVIAYYLEYHAESIAEEWKPDQVADKFPDIRKAKPANMTDLLQKSTFFMSGREKGTYRLSEDGVNWVEGRLGDES